MPAKPNEIQLTRVYDAPVKLVWEAWTDPKQVEKWWGPRGFTLTTKSKNLRPGGKWIYTMHGPDGTDYPNITTYHEVIKYEKLVYDHGGNDERDKLFTVTVTFREEKGKTTLSMTSTLPTPEEAKAMKQFIKNANGNSTWDRLGEYLEKETSGRDLFLINRSFETDIKTVFEMWVNPDLYVRWMGPAGAAMAFIRADVKVGGSSQWSMTTADGQTKYGKLNTYPDTLLTTVTFVEEGANETRVTVRWDVFGEATEAERQAFRDMKPVMTVGWSESFDKLESLLEFRKSTG